LVERESVSSSLMFVLEASDLHEPLLNQIQVLIDAHGKRERVPLVALATDVSIARSVSRAASLLLAAGAARAGSWGSETRDALFALAEMKRLRIAGQEGKAVVGTKMHVQLLWERTDTELKLIARSPRPISKVVDAEPPLYVDDLGQIGELTGVTARQWAWAIKAPAIPTAIDDETVEAAVAGFPAAANILPSVPHYPVVTVASDAMVAELDAELVILDSTGRSRFDALTSRAWRRSAGTIAQGVKSSRRR
jgi:hypothetical protein